MRLDHSNMLRCLYAHNGVSLLPIIFWKEIFTQLVEFEVVVGVGLLFVVVGTVEEEPFVV